MSTAIDLNAAPVISKDGKLPGAPRIPYNAYKFRILEEPTFKAQNTAGNPQLNFKVELIEPKTVTLPEGEFNIEGKEFTVFASLGSGKTGVLKNLHKATGLPAQISLDDATGLPVGIEYTGKEFYAMASSKTENQQTEADADGNRQDIINPLTGKPVTREQNSLNRILTADEE